MTTLPARHVLRPVVSLTVAVAIGAVAAGEACWAFLPNVVAIVIGAAAVFAPTRLSTSLVVRTLAVVGVLLLGGTLLTAGLDGVHRWLRLGPIQLHVSSAWLPWWCLLLLDDDRRWRRRGVAIVVLAQLLHVLQPDAAQATTLAIVVAGFRQPLWLVAVLVLGAALAWGQPDPLQPVAHVEHIHELIAHAGLAAVGGVAAVLLLVVFPSTTPKLRVLRRGLALTLTTSWLLTFAVGAFPCAVFGAGAGPVLGVWGWWWPALRDLSSPTPPSSS